MTAIPRLSFQALLAAVATWNLPGQTRFYTDMMSSIFEMVEKNNG